WYWGLTLNLQSVLTPDVNYFVWIPLEFVEYWIAHLSGVLGPVVLVWGLRFRPTWRGYGVAYGAPGLGAVSAGTGHALAGARSGRCLAPGPARSVAAVPAGRGRAERRGRGADDAPVGAAGPARRHSRARRERAGAASPGGAQPSSSTSASRSGPSESVITRR